MDPVGCWFGARVKRLVMLVHCRGGLWFGGLKIAWIGVCVRCRRSGVRVHCGIVIEFWCLRHCCGCIAIVIGRVKLCSAHDDGQVH